MEFLVGRIKKDLEVEEDKRKTLRELDLIVMDNSIRESTVGQLRGHTMENKWNGYTIKIEQDARFTFTKSELMMTDGYCGEIDLAPQKKMFGEFAELTYSIVAIMFISFIMFLIP